MAGYHAWSALFSEFGLTFDFDGWCDHVLGHGFQPDYAATIDAAAGAQDWDALHARRQALRNARAVAMPGAAALLCDAHARGMATAIVSNSPAEWVRIRLAGAELAASAFDVLISADAGCAPKPAPDGYLAALEVLGCRAEDAIVFEDAPRGVAAARSAGIHCVAVPNPVTARGDFALANEIASSLADVDLDRLRARTPVR
jgi:HAD superfamily hydrolase (TIGR01509 family)